jgi:hypothetical protein
MVAAMHPVSAAAPSGPAAARGRQCQPRHSTRSGPALIGCNAEFEIPDQEIAAEPMPTEVLAPTPP